MSRVSPVIASLLVVAFLTPAFAQDDQSCWDRAEGAYPTNTFLNQGMTTYWRQMLQQADGQLMGQMAGVYYGERPSSDGQYINRQYRSLESNGLFQYQDETCGNIPAIPCSHNQGTGEWRAARQADGTIYMMARFNDLIRTSACFGDRIQFSGAAIRDEGGVIWQRTR